MQSVLQKKDEENRQLAELAQDMERRMKKAQASSKVNSRVKKDLRDKDKDLQKMRKDLLDLKAQNEALQNTVKELRLMKPQQVTRVVAAPLRSNSGKSESNATL